MTTEIQKFQPKLFGMPDDMTMDDIEIPHVRLAQDKSAVLDKDSESFIEDLAPGELYDSLMKERIGPSMHIIPLAFRNGPNVFWENMEVRGRSENGIDGCSVHPICKTCPKLEWGSHANGRGKACTEHKTYIVVQASAAKLPESPRMYILQFKSTGIKTSKEWNAKITMRQDTAGVREHGVYLLSSQKVLGKTPYHKLVVNNYTVIEEQYRGWLSQMAASMRNARVKTEVSDIEQTTSDMA